MAINLGRGFHPFSILALGKVLLSYVLGLHQTGIKPESFKCKENINKEHEHILSCPTRGPFTNRTGERGLGKVSV